MSGYIKSAWRNHTIKRLLSRHRQVQLRKYADIRTVLLVFPVSNEVDWALTQRCAQLLESQGKEPFLLGLVSADERPPFLVAHHNTSTILERKDFNFLGVPRRNILDDILNSHYDILVDLVDKPNFFSQYVALTADVDYRISHVDGADDDNPKSYANSQVFDLVIRHQSPYEMLPYLQNALDYLQVIMK